MGRTIFCFAAVGPFIGSVAFNFVDEFPKHLSVEPALLEELGRLALKSFAKAFLGFFLAYPVGIFPAIASGAAYACVLKVRSISEAGIVWRALAGAVVGLAITGAFGAVLFARDGKAVASWVAAGALAGAICAALSGRRFELRPRSS